MNLENLIKQFEKEAELTDPLPLEGPGSYHLPLEEGLGITIAQTDEGFTMQTTVCPMPNGSEDDFTMHMMDANLMGQGTNGAILGLSDDETDITLMQHCSGEYEYGDFEEKLEDFINMVDFWKEEVGEFETSSGAGQERPYPL